MAHDLLTPRSIALKLPKALDGRERWPLLCDGVLCLLGIDEAQIEQVMRRRWLEGLEQLAAGEGSQEAARIALGAAPVAAALSGGETDPASAAVAEVLQASLDLGRRRAAGLHIALEDGRIQSAQDEHAGRFLADLRRGEQALIEGLTSDQAPGQAFATAAEALHSAIDAFKHDPIAHFLLGWLELHHAADPFSARATFERAVGCRRVDAEFRCLILRHIACALDMLAHRDPGQAGNLREQAANAISEALTIAPEDPVLQWETARHCAATGRLSNAKRLLTEAMAADPALAIEVALDPAFTAYEEDLQEVFRNLRERSRRTAQAAIRQAEAIAEGLRQMSLETSSLSAGLPDDAGDPGPEYATDGLPADEPDGLEEPESLAGLHLAEAMFSQDSHVSCAAAAKVADEARGLLLQEAHDVFGRQLEALYQEREQVGLEAEEVLRAVAQLPDETCLEPQEPGEEDRLFTRLATALLRGALAMALVAVACLVLGGHLWPLGWTLLGLSALMCVPQLMQSMDLRLGLPGCEPAQESMDPEAAHRLRLAAADYQEQLDDIDGRIAEVSAVLAQLAA